MTSKLLIFAGSTRQHSYNRQLAHAAAYRLEMTHFFSQLQSGGAFSTTIEDGVQAQRFADAAAHSAATGQAVQF